jgi:molybdopterin/thiamine biosynthesis adenylyltransferase
LTSRAEIRELASRFEDQIVAIIGLGGTGAYVLDYLAKSRVGQIRGFDGDMFHVHNAFRAPGRTIQDELGKSKAEVLQGRYENFRHGLTLHTTYIDETSTAALDGVTFAFVCVDKGSSRARIFDLLISFGIPFIDVGMGLKKKPTGLSGLVRTTYYSTQQASDVRDRGFAALVDEPDDLYRSNIQIAELNALNAALAVIKYKQIVSFYRADSQAPHHLFSVPELKTYEEGTA